jgi:glycosyltransferase involved in cell wall biosynthesis
MMQVVSSKLGRAMRNSVLIFLDSSAFGGIESHVLVLARLIKLQRPVQVLLWRLYRPDHPLLQQLEQSGIRYQVLDGQFIQLWRVWKNLPDAVLHCHGYKANLLGRLAAFLLGRQLVCSFHNGDVGVGKVRFYTWLDELSSRFSQNIAVSKAIAERLRYRCEVMPNVVDINGGTTIASFTAGVIAFVGRLEQVKRPDRFSALATQFPEHPFSIWGEGSLFPQLKVNQPKNLQLRGAVSSMAAYWCQIELLVICSDHEGFPMVALEAMAEGIPVLSLPLGDLPTLIKHGENGFLAKNTEELSFYLSKWFQLSERQRLMLRQQARQTIVDGYSTQKLWPKLSDFYAKTLKR